MVIVCNVMCNVGPFGRIVSKDRMGGEIIITVDVIYRN